MEMFALARARSIAEYQKQQSIKALDLEKAQTYPQDSKDTNKLAAPLQLQKFESQKINQETDYDCEFWFLMIFR